MGQRHDGYTIIGTADAMEFTTGRLPVLCVKVGGNHGHATRVTAHNDIVGQLLGFHMDVKCRTIIIDDKL